MKERLNKAVQICSELHIQPVSEEVFKLKEDLDNAMKAASVAVIKWGNSMGLSSGNH